MVGINFYTLMTLLIIVFVVGFLFGVQSGRRYERAFRERLYGEDEDWKGKNG